jgi:hypothetical protein
MPLGRRGHVFGAVVDHLHRALRLPRQQGGVAGENRRVLFLAPEPPARLHLHDADLLRRQAEERRQRLVDVVGALHRAPHRDAVHVASEVRHRHHPVRLDVELLLRAGVVLPLDDRVGAVPHGIHVAA